MNKNAKRLLCLALCLMMVLSVLPMAAMAADTETLRVYCQAPDGWTKCNAYWWGSSGENPGWPGNPMKTDRYGIWYIDIPADTPNIIFNNGSGKQSADLKVPTDDKVMFIYNTKKWDVYGKQDVTEPELADYYVAGESTLCGSNWDAADATNGLHDKDGDGIYTKTFEKVAPATYQFKVTNGTWDTNWGGDGPGGNFQFKVVTECDVTVSFDPAAGTISVSGDGLEEIVKEPLVIEAVYAVGVADLTGAEWDPAANQMTAEGSVYTITFTGIAAGTYEFKFAANGTWDISWASGIEMTSGETYDAWFNPMGNSSVVVPGNDATVTLTLDLTNMDAISGEGGTCSVVVECEEIIDPSDPSDPSDPVDPADPTYYVVGSFNGWNPADEAYLMTANEDGTYALTFAVTAGEVQLKVTGGNWDDGNNWGENGGNIVRNATTDGDITVTFDPATFTVTVTGDCLEEIVKEPLVIESIHAVGSEGLFGCEWDQTANAMTNTDGVYTITFTGIAAGTYELKFAANGAWNLNWASGIEMVNGEAQTAWFNPMGNSTVTVTEDNSTVTLTFDTTTMDPITGEGATCKAVIEAEEEEEILAGDVTGDGKINIMDVVKLYAKVKGVADLDEAAIKRADYTGDGKLNIMDVVKLYAYVKG